MATESRRWLCASLALLGACVANDKSTRPPNVPPAPPQPVISTVGFNDAWRIGSDYIYNSQLPDRVFIGGQQLAGNLWVLRFGPGATGGPRVDLLIDTKAGTVLREQPVSTDSEFKLTPAPPSLTPEMPTPPPK